MENGTAATTETLLDSSASFGKLADALAKAQAEMRGATKDAVNPHFKNRYADLASVWDAWRVAGPKNGLAVMQIPVRCNEKSVTIRTVLAHASGEWMASTLTMPVTKGDAQGVGSAMTYARRYALSAMVGIAPEDDDGNAATGADRRQQNEPPPRANGNGNTQRTEPSVELTDARRMLANAKTLDDMDRAKAWIQKNMPETHPDRDTAVREWGKRDKEIAAAQPRAS
jgi:hypothetical protein